MKASDLYYMLGEHDEGGGIWLVEKDFWEKNLHINDVSFGKEIWKILPKWDGENDGFSQDMESHFEYREGERQKTRKGIEFLQSLGIAQVVWGQKQPLTVPETLRDTAEDLLGECLEALYSGLPNQPLIERVEKYLEDNCL